jgi:hypothetical protein
MTAFTDEAHADTARKGGDWLGYEGLRRLLQLAFEDLDIYEQLTAVQALIVYISIFYHPSSVTPSLNSTTSRSASSSSPPSPSGNNPNADPQTALKTLSTWTSHLFTQTSNIQHSLSTTPWQSWLLAESLRRTIILSYGLSMTLASYHRGYCDGWLFVESLPFDSRPGLWMAMSPQAWIAAAGVKRGEDVAGKQWLESYHEYGQRIREAWKGGEGEGEGQMVYREDLFFMLMAFGHEGWEGHWGV